MKKVPRSFVMNYVGGRYGPEQVTYLEHDVKIVLADASNMIRTGTREHDEVITMTIHDEKTGERVFHWEHPRETHRRERERMDRPPWIHDPREMGRYEDSRSSAGLAWRGLPTTSDGVPIVRVPISSPMDLSEPWSSRPLSAGNLTPSARILEVRLDQRLLTGLSDRDTYHLHELQEQYFRDRERNESSFMKAPSSTFERYDYRSAFDPTPRSPRKGR